jgi:hypothetical protein
MSESRVTGCRFLVFGRSRLFMHHPVALDAPALLSHIWVWSFNIPRQNQHLQRH